LWRVEKYLANEQMSFDCIFQRNVKDVRVSDETTHPHSVPPTFVMILCLRAFWMTLPTKLLPDLMGRVLSLKRCGRYEID
jgi:hypothetical protein